MEANDWDGPPPGRDGPAAQEPRRRRPVWIAVGAAIVAVIAVLAVLLAVPVAHAFSFQLTPNGSSQSCEMASWPRGTPVQFSWASTAGGSPASGTFELLDENDAAIYLANGTGGTYSFTVAQAGEYTFTFGPPGGVITVTGSYSAPTWQATGTAVFVPC